MERPLPIDVFQTGAVASSDMNTNEVIATPATQRLGSPVHQWPRQRLAVLR